MRHFCRRLEVHNEQLLDQVTFPPRCVLLRNAVWQDYVRATVLLMLEAEGQAHEAARCRRQRPRQQRRDVRSKACAEGWSRFRRCCGGGDGDSSVAAAARAGA